VEQGHGGEPGDGEPLQLHAVPTGREDRRPADRPGRRLLGVRQPQLLADLQPLVRRPAFGPLPRTPAPLPDLHGRLGLRAAAAVPELTDACRSWHTTATNLVL